MNFIVRTNKFVVFSAPGAERRVQRVAYGFIVRTWYSPAGPLKVSETAYVRKDLGKARTEKTVSSGFQETDGFTGRRGFVRDAGCFLLPSANSL